MRRPCSRFRRTAVLLLLALRAGQRSVDPEGGLRGPRGLREGEVGSPPSDGRLPSEGGTGVRPAPRPDRKPHRPVPYLYLEVRASGTALPATEPQHSFLSVRGVSSVVDIQ